MKATLATKRNALSRQRPVGLLDRIAQQAVLQRLRHISFGSLLIHDDQEVHQFGGGAHDGLHATIVVNDPCFYRQIAFAGTIGAGEAYMDGHFECSNLTAAVRLLLRNRQVLDGMDSSVTRITAPLHKAFHWLHRNTRSGSERNIAAHYDLGNELFELFLDETMMYSGAIFEKPDASLHDASLTKLDRICRKLDLRPDDHVVEIGTGWGGFAVHAATRYGCRVTTTTISKAQHEFTSRKIRKAGLSDRVTVLLKDYRDLTGSYDKLVSIEMIEAIGHQYLDTYFEKCSGLLKPSGMLLLQAITIADQRYEAAKGSVDFIQRYIFPGSFIPSVSAMTQAIARSTDMRLFHLEDIGPHYATTLRHWRERFGQRLSRVRELGYPESFIRMWEFYLCYCEGGFLERAIGDAQLLLIKPGCRREPITSALDSSDRYCVHQPSLS
ncbi:MAG: cyclopropane-fatty-acyl-phospholipid synthase family protein [Gammaproteobacteria bacterium]|nr:cyclopropane-fatty-acyl-phospholipid synthase family protein [Gammaproteobacteria bacterium]